MGVNVDVEGEGALLPGAEMIEFELLARGCYRPDQVLIKYDPTLRMPITRELQAWMDILWQQQVERASERGTRLFDAPLFRYVDATSHPDGTLSIVVGDTSYKEYATTRTPEFAQRHARQELGNALAVCSVVETSDGYILLDKRQGVDVYVGRYHVIGGFFERNLDMATAPDPFGAIRREIREETGIQTTDIKEQFCLGVVYDLTTPHAEMCFLTRLNIPWKKVLTREPEENEIQQLNSLRVTEKSLREFITRNHGHISATGEPNLLLYGEWKFGMEWFENTMGKL
jgi:8-oxo-dGTP pyrophosphatase MutT (NUDIX family)